MKRHFHFSISAALGMIGLWKEFGNMPLDGAGQSVLELSRAGYSRLEIAHYFPWTILNLGLLVASILLAAYGVGKKRAISHER